MSAVTITPFDRVEAAQEYLKLLSQAVADNRQIVEAEMRKMANGRRSFEALSLISYNLEKLESHLKSSRQILNNLNKLRNLLFKNNGMGIASEPMVTQCSALER